MEPTCEIRKCGEIYPLINTMKAASPLANSKLKNLIILLVKT